MAYLLRCNPPCYFVLLSSSRTVIVAYSWFVGELFDRGVGCEAEGAGAHKVDVGVGVVGRPRGVAVEVAAVGTDDERRFEFRLDSHRSVEYRHVVGVDTLLAEVVQGLVHRHTPSVGAFLLVVDAPQTRAGRHQLVARALLLHIFLKAKHTYILRLVFSRVSFRNSGSTVLVLMTTPP